MERNVFICKSLIVIFLSVIALSCESNDEEELDSREVDFLKISRNYSITLRETVMGIGSDRTLGLVKDISSDQDGIFYTIKSQNPEGSLKIDPGFGRLEIADITFFDYEFYPEITAEVEAKYGDLTRDIDVTVKMMDLDDQSDIKYKDERVVLQNLREVSQGISTVDGFQEMRIQLGSSGLNFTNFSGISGTGTYLGFSFYVKDFQRDAAVFEKEFVLDETTNEFNSDFIFLEINRAFTSGWQSEIESKTITKGKLIYKREATTNLQNGLREFFYDIKFMFNFSDGSILTGSYNDIGVSSYY